MPMYYWEDKKTGYGIEVIRKFDDYKQPPEESELPKEEQGKAREWQRLLKKAPGVTKSRNWGPGKGYW